MKLKVKPFFIICRITGQKDCLTQCPAGFACPNRNSTEECVAGTSSALGDHLCTACANGFYADTTRMYNK